MDSGTILHDMLLNSPFELNASRMSALTANNKINNLMK